MQKPKRFDSTSTSTIKAERPMGQGHRNVSAPTGSEETSEPLPVASGDKIRRAAAATPDTKHKVIAAYRKAREAAQLARREGMVGRAAVARANVKKRADGYPQHEYTVVTKAHRRLLASASPEANGIVERVEAAGTHVDLKARGAAHYQSPSREILDAVATPKVMHRSFVSRGQTTVPRDGAAIADSVIHSVADIGRHIREARTAMGMTQQRFADLAGVGRRFLIELEQGKPSLEFGLVLKVCKAAGLKLGMHR